MEKRFSALLNGPSTVQPRIIEALPRANAVPDMDLPTNMAEFSRSIRRLRSGMATGPYGITPNKVAEPVLAGGLCTLSAKVWVTESLQT